MKAIVQKRYGAPERGPPPALGHSSIQTTAGTYTDWDIEQLAQTFAEVLQETDDESFPP